MQPPSPDTVNCVHTAQGENNTICTNSARVKLTIFTRNSCFCTETSPSSQCSNQTKHPQPGLKPRLQEISVGVYFPMKKESHPNRKISG